MHLLEQLARPVVIAHRGASAHAPENTLAAFRLALEHGADGIELDAKLTADGQVVVIHDQMTDRTTGVPGVVRKMTLAELRLLDAGSRFSPAFEGEPIPTLEEVLDAVGSQMLVNIELTNYASPGDALPEVVAEMVNRIGLRERVMFSTFHPLTLARIRRRLPDVPAALITLSGVPGRLIRVLFGRGSPDYIHPYYTDVAEAFIAREHRHARRVNAWTVNDPRQMKRLFQIGIDGIITDDPRLARTVLEER